MDDAVIIVSSHVLVSDYGSRHSTPNGDSSYERKLLRVRESLSKLKRKTDSAALGFLSHLLDTKLDEKEKGKLSSLPHCDLLLLCRVSFRARVLDIRWKG